MLRLLSFLILTLSLTGCISSYTPIMPAHAHAFFAGDALCLTTPERTEKQKLQGISIEKRGESPGFSQFFKNPDEYLIVKKDTCIPTFDYKFETGSAYNVSIYFTTDTERLKPDASLGSYSVSFVIWETSKKEKQVTYL
ncbi:hypothetical protein JHW33_06360 [Rahnella aceris]|uniref:putative T6SS immunity periplasmic lipoprotein n=1 Tax=Rahnella sp. (strain Y9602) TaxID=2703885 RepID=UPI001904CC8E|nr:putative T6SS immunity periplasmic lipoprotein [Rahnella aceris]QQN36249.1 hypothetical protein JHW33_06360 [Rahnella aceris]